MKNNTYITLIVAPAVIFLALAAAALRYFKNQKIDEDLKWKATLKSMSDHERFSNFGGGRKKRRIRKH
jgi:hypothetical protein